MFYDLLRGGLTLLQHVLDEIDAPAWTIELVAKQEISRAGRGAEAAMNAGAEDFFRFPHVRICKLREREIGLHARENIPTRYSCHFFRKPELSLESRPFVA